MILALNLPDVVCASLQEDGADAVRTAEEILVLGLYREGRLSAPDAMRALGIGKRAVFEQRVAEHRAEREWSDDEIAQELETIQRINR
jgi:hypothetical protein